MYIIKSNDLTSVTSSDQLSQGDKVTITNYVAISEYCGEEQEYIFEQYNEDKMVLVTTDDMRRKYAVATNDCERDNLQPYQASKIVLELNDKIILVHYGKDDKSPKQIDVLNIDSTTRRGKLVDIEATCISKFDTLSYPEWAINVVQHIASEYYNRHMPCQMIRRLSYNNSRTIRYGLFTRNHKGELMMQRNGVTYILNNNSSAQKDLEGNRIEEGIYRFFYSSKFKNSPVVFVDGIHLDERFTHFNVDEYINSKTTTTDIRNSVKKFTTAKGSRFNGILQTNGGIKIVIKVGREYQLIHLSTHEVEHIVEIEPVIH